MPSRAITRSRSQWLQEATAPRRSVSALAPAGGSHEALSEAPDLRNPREIHHLRHRTHPARFVASSREGSQNQAIGDRLELTGARWSIAGAEAILRLRSLVSSGDFDEYWQFHEDKEKERNHLAHYAGKVLPQLRQQGPGKHLRLVK